MHSSSSSSSAASVVVPGATFWSRSLTRLLRGSGWLLLGLCALLAVLSYHGFTVYCENFGCIYLGLIWMVWGVLAGVGLVMALLVRAWQRHRGFSTRASSWAVVLLLAMGAGHLLYWLVTTALR
ncbi:hypothetical protein [Acidovorax carolinensis]|jgi:hypothetical protein|uniref:hypothetical protein n=1 Tax=Acidovorax carolinensis TaxID=553814 RepID=UPI001F2D49E2|nr:hypothetical protein [Acidovorax carolinensis]